MEEFSLSQQIGRPETVFSIALTLALLASPAHAENLLINASFERADSEGMPRPWSLFIMPQEGADGRLDTKAMRGASSIMLHTSEAYETEPANNWSQVIITDAASKDLRLTGYIRTENATEAALWDQPLTLENLHLAPQGKRIKDNFVLGDEATSIAEALEFKKNGGSTIVEVTGAVPRFVRSGAISEKTIHSYLAELGEPLAVPQNPVLT